MFRIILFLVATLILLPFQSAKAQDPEFSQFYAAPMNLNPALAGVAWGPRFNANYRNQWPGLEKGFVTYAVAYDQYFEKARSGFGLQIMNDQTAAGLINNYSIRLNYAFRFNLSKKIAVQMGISGGYIRKQLDWASLTFNDQINPIFGFSDGTGAPNISGEQVPADFGINIADFGTGFIAYSKHFFGGLALQHITSPRESITEYTDYKLPMKITVHAGGEINLTPKKRNSENSLTPNAMFITQGTASQLNIGTHVNIGKVFGGIYYRNNFSNSDAVIGVLGLKIYFVRVGYSYDYTVSTLAGNTGGAHEISLSINLGAKDGPFDHTRKPNRLECPGILNF